MNKLPDLEAVALSETEKLREILSNNGWQISEAERKQYNHEFTAALDSRKFKVQVYFGKKGIKKVVQGNRDLPEYKKLEEIVNGTLSLFNTEEIEEPEEYIGTDESGKGDIFGPLCIAAVFVNSKSKEELKRIGVKDSKALSKQEILSLAKKIVKVTDNNFVVLELTPEKYNALYEKFGNLNKLLSWAHSEIIKKLLQKVSCKTVITDKFSRKDLEIEKEFDFRTVQFLKYSKGERFTGVAAASILARAKFEEWFHKNKFNGKVLPKGASGKAEEFLQGILKEHEKQKLFKYAKLHFKSFEKFQIRKRGINGT